MNEIELYMSLVDEKEVNSIIKFFDINVRSNNLSLKKTKIMTLLRGNIPISKAKSKPHIRPFIAMINRHKQSDWEKLSDKEFLIMLNKESENVPDYIKLANLIIKYPDEREKYFELIKKNKDNDKYIFNFDCEFSNEEELIEYTTKLADDKETLLKNITNNMQKLLKLKCINPNIKDLKDVKNWNLIELYNNIEYNTEKEENNCYIKIEYMKSHEEMDKEIFNILYLDIMVFVVDKLEKKYMDNEKETFIRVKNIISGLEKETKYLEKERLKKIEEQTKTIKELKNELTDSNLNKEELKNAQFEIEKQTIENEKLLKQLKGLQEKNNIMDKQSKEDKIKIKEYDTKIADIEQYYKYSFLLNKREEKVFGIIHNIDIEVSKIIFSEVQFMHKDEWKNQIQNVDKIYVQREGIDRRERNKIKDYCNMNNIEIINTISIYNEKDLIEKVSILKKENGVK